MDDSAQRLLEDLLGFAGTYAGRSLRISVKTNYGPEIPVATANLGGGGGNVGATGALGLKAAIIVRDDNGRAVATFGDPPATDGWRVVILIVLAALLLALAIRGVRSLR